ncbi:MAG: DUF4258 domain-containing protein [Methanomicrobia archaeon]|nr:DUF4258 domain-containing protein [Methanomicrobia archaeon]
MICFKVTTPLDKEIRVTKRYWEFIATVKHPVMRGKEKAVALTLKDPDFIRRSRKDQSVYFYYGWAKGKYICVVCKHLNAEGFIITTYITSRVKEGEEIWRKS